jgi:hypothetical protein
MNKIRLLFLFCLLILRGGISAQNIYKSIGKEAKILTLSNGKYQEIITNDTIVRIGTVLFNTVQKEVVAFLDSADTEGVIEADVASRFLSVDPIGRDFPELTPYAFAENDVIRSIDLDGLEKVALSGDAPSNQYAGNGTHYYKNQAQMFAAQTLRLKKVYGFFPHRVHSGKELLYHLKETTRIHGSISVFAYFGHSGSNGLYMTNDAGFYTGISTKTSEEHPNFYSNVAELSYLMKKGEIKFAENACIILASCNTASIADYTAHNTDSDIQADDLFAGSLVLETGVTVIASTGLVSMVDEKKADGRLKSSGEFFKFERIKEEKDGKTTYRIEATNLGNTINVDDYVRK